ncbi:hypothetical protein M569_01536 [Genlisea aurea]|uniref:Uncharacterized protein n=1 Tax=Genlisea aurea TaxID=192259 RepID=S8D0B6_9LAMI|nr:hypothetical protein M569_01536 [Genlisea aurea]
MANPEGNRPPPSLDYWLKPQVLISALIFSIPAAVAVSLLLSKRSSTVRSSDLSTTCWKDLHPRWLLLYRALAFLAMAVLLYQITSSFGLTVFFFYTQWTFTLEMLYFLVAAILSARRFWIQHKTATTASELPKDQQLGFPENAMLIMYQISGGAVMLTDIVFWCLLLPFLIDEAFKVTLLIGAIHSVNAVFLIIESSLNNLPFTWFGLNYFILWSCAYAIFQWTLHACCISWWPYPFLELSTPWAPLWYLAMALVHLPCYGAYVMLAKAKDTTFPRMFPQAFVRAKAE